MRAFYLIPALGFLAACEPPIPDSGAGVGFNTPDYQAQREAALEQGTTVNGDPLIPPAAVSSEALPLVGGQPLAAPTTQTAQAASATSTVATAAEVADETGLYTPRASDTPEDIARETAAALAAAGQNSGELPLEASPSNPAPALISNPGISNEQDFSAVSDQRSIEGDAALIERNRSQYQQVAPTAVPERAGNAQPNVVQYALSTSHPKGTKLYSRAGFNLAAKAQRNCAAYASADQAQVEFLSNGGPRRDRKGLDPDGDGYACGWDPAKFRKAVGN